MKRFALTLLLFNGLLLALLLPRYPWIPWVAAEALMVCAVFSLLSPSLFTRVLACVVGTLYAVLALFTLSDLLVRQSLGRGLNLYLELGVVGSVVDLILGNLGTGLSLLILLALLLAFCGLAFWVSKLLSRLAGGLHSSFGKTVFATGLLVVAVSFVPQSVVSLSAAQLTTAQIQLAVDTRQSTAEFSQSLANDPAAGKPVALPGLASTDVIFGFIESYGISSLADDRFQHLIGPRLDKMEAAVSAAGLHMVSGRLRSPVQGGQSWLAHATLLSGQWTDTQLDYEILLASDYPTLIDDMAETGHDTVAVMPAITEDWPEGQAFGYNRIYESTTMDYQGPAFNWVTMPDQYTWSWFQRSVREPAAGPMFAEVALISSHAPWVPILPVLDDWDSVGNGTVFNQWKGAGETPASLWREPDRVREHYALAIDYALNVATGYATRHVDENTLLVLLGDHQPAPLVTGEGVSRDVIVHVISGNPELLAPFLATGSRGGGLLGFQPGAKPDLNQDGPSMASFRPFMLREFSRALLKTEVASVEDVEQQ
ncbi:hypothetical protein ATG98_3271 [Marinobacter sp. LV10R520-4]|uniref:hypothetical protein n=1 Tax=Marinobacter sp. LV10R520-4 TaxID=1761796 RepID=UPI000BF91E6D|nr:hypothetical protein [Marinobacter sp. LV10R520-4]PFG54083.1 hypothetical protein ATG98_3271 [Marinobacter sp. LV10R520-4]